MLSVMGKILINKLFVVYSSPPYHKRMNDMVLKQRNNEIIHFIKFGNKKKGRDGGSSIDGLKNKNHFFFT